MNTLKIAAAVAAGMMTATLAAAPAAALMPVAAPVSVTDVVTGTAGAYTHSFTLTNNIGGTNALYFFGVDLSGSIVGTPASWANSGNQNGGWSNANYGGSSTTYPNTWCCSFGGTPSGTTTSGFDVLSTTAATTVKFFAYATGGVDSNADGHFNNDYNPGYEGVVGATVPEPALWVMMIAGFGAVGGTLRRSRTGTAAVAR